jgi:hypothetical protein
MKPVFQSDTLPSIHLKGLKLTLEVYSTAIGLITTIGLGVGALVATYYFMTIGFFPTKISFVQLAFILVIFGCWTALLASFLIFAAYPIISVLLPVLILPGLQRVCERLPKGAATDYLDPICEEGRFLLSALRCSLAMLLSLPAILIAPYSEGVAVGFFVAALAISLYYMGKSEMPDPDRATRIFGHTFSVLVGVLGLWTLLIRVRWPLALGCFCVGIYLTTLLWVAKANYTSAMNRVGVLRHNTTLAVGSFVLIILGDSTMSLGLINYSFSVLGIRREAVSLRSVAPVNSEFERIVRKCNTSDPAHLADSSLSCVESLGNDVLIFRNITILCDGLGDTVHVEMYQQGVKNSVRYSFDKKEVRILPKLNKDDVP